MIGWYATHAPQTLMGIVIICFSLWFGFAAAHAKPFWLRVLISICVMVVLGLFAFYTTELLDWISAPFGSTE
jgi:hypothetical protein